MTADQTAPDEARQLVVKLVQMLHGDLNSLSYATDERIYSPQDFASARAWLRRRWNRLEQAADAYEATLTAAAAAQPEEPRP